MKMQKNSRALQVGAILTLAALLVSGCATTRLAQPLPAPEKTWEKVAVIQEMILPPYLPSIPLVQAGLHKKAYSKIESDVAKLHQEKIDDFQEEIGKTLAQNAPFDVLYGNELLKVTAFKNLDGAVIQTFETTTEGREDHSMALPSRGYNFFDFKGKGMNPKNAFVSTDNQFLASHADSLGALCRSLDVDSVVVASLNVKTPQVNFLAQGPKNLVLRLAFFDRSGNAYHVTSQEMKGLTGSGGDLDVYTMTLDKFPELIKDAMSRLVPTPPVP